MSSAGSPAVIIIGGGMGGVAAAVKLQRAGINSFSILEKSPGPGGTWWENRYPGAEVDVPSHLYSFSFRSSDWTRTHARQPELQGYIEQVIDEFGLRPHFRFNTTVVEVRWMEDDFEYEVTLSDGEVLRSHAVISAVGLLNHPRYPDWPGLDQFEGPKFHTARWEPEHDLSDKRVAVVGTGSTSTQMVPALAELAGHVVVFQREPGWVIPKGDRDFSDAERISFRQPLRRRRARLQALWMMQKRQMWKSEYRPGSKYNTSGEQVCRGYIDEVFKDRPDLRDAVTPAYPWMGKRPIICSTFYPSLLRENVELIPHAVTSVTKSGVVDARGIEHPIDVLVMATGFQPANFLATLKVVGRGGRTLSEVWGGEPQAFLGITVPGFPNFYMLYGPNTNGGEIISHLERQAEFAARSIRRLSHSDIAAVEVRKSFYSLYNRWLQRKMQDTSWVVSNNYYKSSSGRIVTQWPYGSIEYGALTKVLRRPSEIVTRYRTSKRNLVPVSDRRGSPLQMEEA